VALVPAEIAETQDLLALGPLEEPPACGRLARRVGSRLAEVRSLRRLRAAGRTADR
jgi:hypothetical protein